MNIYELKSLKPVEGEFTFNSSSDNYLNIGFLNKGSVVSLTINLNDNPPTINEVSFLKNHPKTSLEELITSEVVISELLRELFKDY